MPGCTVQEYFMHCQGHGKRMDAGLGCLFPATLGTKLRFPVFFCAAEIGLEGVWARAGSRRGPGSPDWSGESYLK